MAEIVGSAVAGETVRWLSLLLSGDDGDRETTEIKVERLEMAAIKLETVIAMSEDWQITHPPLLHWKAKLKRMAKDGKAILRAHKSHTMRNNRRSSFSRRMARVAKRFVPFSRGAPDDMTEAMVRRFEKLADGADEFFKFVKCGSRPKILMFLPALAPSLAAGKSMELSLRMGGGTAVILLQPWWLEGNEESNGAKACLWISYEHDMAWEKNLKMIAVFNLSESLDIMTTAMNCVELLPQQQFSAARAAMKELVAEMAFHGRKSAAPSAVYVSFVRAIQDCHHYGFESMRRCTGTGGGSLPDPVLLICAHCYVLPLEQTPSSHGGCGGLPLELVWHSSPHYFPKKLSERHEQVRAEVLPGMADGFYHQEAGAFEHGRQWWCPHSSTRLSMVPVSSPPKSLLQFYKEKFRTAGVGSA